MRKLIILLCLPLLTQPTLAFAKTVKTELGTPFNVFEFNSVASTYMQRPTFVTFVDREKKADRIFINADFIHKEEYAVYNNGHKFLGVSENIISESIAAVDKYLKWEEIASKDGDILRKDISKIDGKGKYADVLYSFYSGNKSTHYLSVSACGLGICNASTPMLMDKKNAELFRGFLIKWQSGENLGLSTEELEDKYK